MTFPDTDGITYTADPAGPYVLLPQVVTVTATLTDAGVGWPATLPAGWTETGSTTATYGRWCCGRAVFPGASDGSGGDAGDVYCW